MELKSKNTIYLPPYFPAFFIFIFEKMIHFILWKLETLHVSTLNIIWRKAFFSMLDVFVKQNKGISRLKNP